MQTVRQHQRRENYPVSQYSLSKMPFKLGTRSHTSWRGSMHSTRLMRLSRSGVMNSNSRGYNKKSKSFRRPRTKGYAEKTRLEQIRMVLYSRLDRVTMGYLHCLYPNSSGLCLVLPEIPYHLDCPLPDQDLDRRVWQ